MEFIRNRFCNFLDHFFRSDFFIPFLGQEGARDNCRRKLGYITYWIGVFVATLTLWNTQPPFLCVCSRVSFCSQLVPRQLWIHSLALWIMMLIKMGQTKSTIFRCPLFIVFPCIWNIYLAFYLQCLIILPVLLLLLLRFQMPESHYSWSLLPLPPSPPPPPPPSCHRVFIYFHWFKHPKSFQQHTLTHIHKHI